MHEYYVEHLHSLANNNAFEAKHIPMLLKAAF
jgi:hypothetical protein